MRKLPQGEGLRGTTDHPGAGTPQRSNVRHVDFRAPKRSKLQPQPVFIRANAGLVEIELSGPHELLKLSPEQARFWRDALDQFAVTAEQQAEGTEHG